MKRLPTHARRCIEKSAEMIDGKAFADARLRERVRNLMKRKSLNEQTSLEEF
jgi:hypothetical protein